MIDPTFEKRLWNWSRASSVRRSGSITSPTASAMEALRYVYGTIEGGIDSGERPTPIDFKDAAILDAAYRGPWLTLAEKRVIRLRYAEQKSEAVCAKTIGVGYHFFRRNVGDVVKHFQRIVEEKIEKPMGTH